MSIKHPTEADLAHLREGDHVEVRINESWMRGRLVLVDERLLLNGWTVRRLDGGPGAALTELISPLPPTSAVDNAVTVSGGSVVWHDVLFSPDEARRNADTMRKVADRLCEAADEAERLPDGVYRVTFRDSRSGTAIFLRVVDGEVLTPSGYTLSLAVVHERIGDIPSAT